MKTQQHLTRIAEKSLHPKKVATGWKVQQGSTVLYESKDYGLCMYFIRTHSLKLTPKPTYK